MMMYCKYCGKEVYSDAVVCIHCGRNLKECEDTGAAAVEGGHFIWAIVSFIAPIVGFILYILWKNKKPQNAVLTGRGALVGMFAWIGLLILGALIAVIIFVSAMVSQGAMPLTL